MLEIFDEGMLSRVPGRGAYMPSITELGDGSLIACRHVGRELGAPDNHIKVLRSSDGSRPAASEPSSSTSHLIATLASTTRRIMQPDVRSHDLPG